MTNMIYCEIHPTNYDSYHGPRFCRILSKISLFGRLLSVAQHSRAISLDLARPPIRAKQDLPIKESSSLVLHLKYVHNLDDHIDIFFFVVSASIIDDPVPLL